MNFRSRMLREALSFDWLRTKSGHLEGNVRGCCLDTKSLVNGESNEGQRRSTKSTKSHLSNEPGPDGAHHRELRRSTTNQRWERGASRFHSVGGGDLPEIKNRPQRYRHELLLPTVSTQVRYINERTIEIFTSDARGRVELHDILHPNMSRNLSYKVESLDLTDGDPAHRITSRDLVDRTPFSVYGTFDGSVAITKSICSPEIKKISVLKIWQANEPIQLVRVNQLDNGLLAVTNFPHLPVESCLFVLDIAGQRQVALKSRQVFHATSCSKIFDVCWLWDHPARLLLSTVDSIRMFDIRCPNKTEQALYLNHTITHMASNKFRTHIFAAFNGEELHIYDNRQLFGPVQQIKVPIDGYSELNSMRWNPYMPYELFLHFRASSSILRCSAPDLPFDPFRV
ncbi:hypothetical protein KIN20_006198 [Parelaphostrongylus tenuis]|uniref:Uncharacterized protein n=1 Tax=Parelaphostrongylus tenuis TaxID=148309 RepID=A0AAD5QFS9_PARTN|nr:hypothetical protein KIN20_006198 [Parelaphostrongylus tenuis]